MQYLSQQIITQWVTGSVVIVVWFLLLLPTQRLLFHFFRKRLASKPFHFGHVILEALKWPLTLLILAGALAIGRQLFPLSERIAQIGSLIVNIIIIFSLIIALNHLFMNLLIRFARRHVALLHYMGIAKGIVRIIILVPGLLIILDTFGISITPLLASLGIASFTIGLALQDTLANLFSGIYVILDKPIEVGNYVELEGKQNGFVEKIGWRSTRIRMLSNNTIIVPNSKIANTILTNYHRPESEMAVLVECQVDYRSDLQHVERVTAEVGKEIMKTVEGGIPSFEPFIRYNKFDSSSINFTIILRGKDFVSQYLIKHEFIKRLQKRYQQEGIVIPFPIRTVIMDSAPSVRA